MPDSQVARDSPLSMARSLDIFHFQNSKTRGTAVKPIRHLKM